MPVHSGNESAQIEMDTIIAIITTVPNEQNMAFLRLGLAFPHFFLNRHRLILKYIPILNPFSSFFEAYSCLVLLGFLSLQCFIISQSDCLLSFATGSF